MRAPPIPPPIPPPIAAAFEVPLEDDVLACVGAKSVAGVEDVIEPVATAEVVDGADAVLVVDVADGLIRFM